MKNSPGKAALITSLLLLLLFPNLLVLLGYTVNESIFLGIVAGISGGLIAGWSNMEEETKPSANTDSQLLNKEEEMPAEKEAEKEAIQGQTENNDGANNTNEGSSETKSDRDLTPAQKSEISELTTDSPQENQKNYEPIKTVNYELKFLDTSPEENTELPNKSSQKNNPNSQKSASKIKASSRDRRKKVSLFSWLLTKQGESSKTRR